MRSATDKRGTLGSLKSNQGAAAVSLSPRGLLGGGVGPAGGRAPTWRSWRNSAARRPDRGSASRPQSSSQMGGRLGD